ncbi:hypothetical protein AB0H82_04825 [Streptomyces sp. NPDC050732]|uniref:hypothetical protein n=1 Tax=Streptomyces sp. NPDC050732 TaxID=3154632 RepID=UPI00343BFDEB
MTNSPLLLSIVGIVGALAGGGLTGFMNARIERRREAVTERQQIRQEQAAERTHLRDLQIEHYRWRRDRRQSAYVDFHAKSQKVLLVFSKVNAEVGRGQGGRESTRQLLEEAHEATSDALHSTAVVQIEGPAEVGIRASVIQVRLTLLVASAAAALDSLDEAARYNRELKEAIQSLSEAQGEFLTAAQVAMNEVVAVE